jgi:hypothetical protein
MQKEDLYKHAKKEFSDYLKDRDKWLREPPNVGEKLTAIQKVRRPKGTTTSSAASNAASSAASSASSTQASQQGDASKTDFPKSKLLVTEPQPLKERLERWRQDVQGALDDMLESTKCLVHKWQELILNIMKARSTKELSEVNVTQHVTKAFFVVFGKDIMKLQNAAIFKATVKGQSNMDDSEPVSFVPDLVVAHTTGQNFEESQNNYKRTVLNIEEKRPGIDIKWASENQVLWQSSGIMQQWPDSVVEKLESGQFEETGITTSTFGFCFTSAAERPGKLGGNVGQKWRITSTGLIEDSEQIAGELVDRFMMLKKMLELMQESSMSEGGHVELTQGALRDLESDTTRDDASQPPLPQSRGNHSRNTAKALRRGGRKGGAVEEMFSHTSVSTVIKQCANTQVALQHVGAQVADEWSSAEGSGGSPSGDKEIVMSPSDLKKIWRFLNSFDERTICKFARSVCGFACLTLHM